MEETAETGPRIGEGGSRKKRRLGDLVQVTPGHSTHPCLPWFLVTTLLQRELAKRVKTALWNHNPDNLEACR